MKFLPTTLKDAWVIDLEKRGDARGFFARSMCTKEFEEHGLLTRFVQQNVSMSAEKGTLRGMHFQRGDAVEAKLVRCTRGAILDVIIDLRHDSPTYLKHEAFELTAQSHRQLYVPPGFAHSFQTLTDDMEATYLVSAPYTPEAEWGVRYSDPLFSISWPLPVSNISEKDANWPLYDPNAKPYF
jgi:dTDP-4-dehydrorhamnose 3,5-epimerase